MLGPLATISEPAVEPIELVSAKRFLRVDGTAQDDDVRMLIGAARRDLEQTTGQRLIEQTVRVRALRFSDLAVLPVAPVMSIVEITYVDGTERKSIDLETVDLTGARLERGIELVPGNNWPTHTPGPIAVDLKVGYGPTGASVPENLRWAMFALMRGKFDDRAVNIESLVVNERIYG